MATTIPVGSNSNSTYVAYGDDCQFGDICAYALVVVKRQRIGWILRELDLIKQHFKLPTSTALHCRVLFSGHQRGKVAELAHLSPADVRSIVIRIFLLFNNVGIHICFAHTSLRGFSETMGETINMWDEAKSSRVDLSIHHDPKGVISMLAQMCMMAPSPHRRFAKPHEWEIVISRDKTTVRLFGDSGRQAHNLVNGHSEIGAPAGQIFQFQQRVCSDSEAPLLQLADVAAYALAHAQEQDPKDRFWQRDLPSLNLRHDIFFKPRHPGHPIPEATVAND